MRGCTRTAPVTPARALAVTLGAVLLVVMPLGAGEAAAASPTAKSLRTLVRQTNALPRTAAPAAARNRLRRTARHARRVHRRRPCTAVRNLARYRRLLRGVRPRPGRAGQRLARLGPTSLRASRRLLASRRTRRCGGGVKRPSRRNTQMNVLQSDENGMRIRVNLPDLRFASETGGGQSWAKISLPNTDSPAEPGKPGIPVASEVFGVPDGATLSIDTGNTTSYKLDGVDVFPAQPDPVDDEPPPDFTAPPFETPPFTIDRDAYGQRGFAPAAPADGQILGTARDVVIGGLQVSAARYNAAARTLRVYTSVVVNVEFQGGPHTFSEQLASPWEGPQLQFVKTLLNRDVIRSRVAELIRRCGEEMLVITNPSTLAAANQFATARRAAGIRTSVFQTGTGSGQIGTTATDIQTFIRSRLNALLCIRPSYVTIMGDDDLVPTFPGINGIPSDLQYSMRDDADELPDLAVGRIIGNDQAAVATAVSKIIGYETTVPGANAAQRANFLGRATIAAQFQDDNLDGRENRTFIQYAETVRNGLMGRGVAVDRVYEDSPVATPTQFNDGTALPAELQKPTFAWNGTGADVTAAWNDGRFLVIHRDHGWSDGWGHPGYNTGNVQALTNGSELPVVMSINCSSGAYDYDETSFAGESLVNANGGSVGVFGDTRDSPTWHNTQIALGFVDGLLPSVLPAEGPSTKQRVGNALITGKLRLAGLAPPSGPGITGGDGSTRNELYLWHYFGDPSMQMWGGGAPPFLLDAAQIDTVFTRQVGPGPDPPPYVVNVTLPAELAGQTISLLRDGQVIGKATIGTDGKASIPASFGDGSPKPGELEVAVEPDGGTPVRKRVDGVPRRSTRLNISCPGTVGFNDPATTNGSIDPAFAGATIELTYRQPDGETFQRTTTTNAQGQWSHTIDTGADDPNGGGNGGTWTVTARYGGDSENAPSEAVSCTFEEEDG